MNFTSSLGLCPSVQIIAQHSRVGPAKVGRLVEPNGTQARPCSHVRFTVPGTPSKNRA